MLSLWPLWAACTPHDPSGVPTTLPCEVDEDLQISIDEVAVTAHEATIAASTSLPTRVAVACTRDGDGSEVHLVEGDRADRDHALRVGGLLADQLYRCEAAAVCPATEAPEAFEVRTAPEPTPVPIEITVADASDRGSYVLLNHAIGCDWRQHQLIVADRRGRIRWRLGLDPGVGPSVEFRHHGGGRFVWGGGWRPNAGGRPRIVDLFDGEIYDSAEALVDVDQGAFHHDGKQLPDGRLLTLEEEAVEADGFSFLGFRVRRIDPETGIVDFDYRSQRAYDEGWLPAGIGDAWHANWADLVDGTLYVSLCDLSQVVAIDVPSGEWRWAFGRGGDFSVVDAARSPLGAEGNPRVPARPRGLRRSAARLRQWIRPRSEPAPSEYRPGRREDGGDAAVGVHRAWLVRRHPRGRGLAAVRQRARHGRAHRLPHPEFQAIARP